MAGVGRQLEALEKRLTDAVRFLPPYDVRRAQEVREPTPASWLRCV
jgi:hypothetical protein